MKTTFRRFGRSLWKIISRFFTGLGVFIWAIPGKLRSLLFTFARWGKRQLDKRINSKQREWLHTIIFESETREGRRFDLVITWLIVCSIVVVMLETVADFRKVYWWSFFILEWVFTLFFTLEYILRLYAARQPLRYATSFFGIVDLLAILPSYLGIFFIGAQNLIIVRALRLLRVFRIFKMGHFVTEGEVILNALKASKVKIYIFISFVVLISLIIGSMMYIVEGGTNPNLDNIPKGVYWAIVTLTTVGYGDVIPITAVGRFLATVVMVMGYGVIAVPTGIVTAEITGRVLKMKEIITKICEECGQSEHHTASTYCHRCGYKL